jgi:hypothetical protein
MTDFGISSAELSDPFLQNVSKKKKIINMVMATNFEIISDNFQVIEIYKSKENVSVLN